MAHQSEDSHPLALRQICIQDSETLLQTTRGFTDVCMLILPGCANNAKCNCALENIGQLVAQVAEHLDKNATLITVGEVIDLVQVQASMPSSARYQNWIAIQRIIPRAINRRFLPNHHFGALISTKYSQSLRHTKTRIKYTYCPACHKTTKDYGGKKHTYHHYGTLMSDVWRDTQSELNGDLTSVINRFQDLFGLESYKELLVLDCQKISLERIPGSYNLKRDVNESFVIGKDTQSDYQSEQITDLQTSFLFRVNYALHSVNPDEILESPLPQELTNQVLHGDCLEWLREIPDNTIDFIFTDPPYNLGKKYSGYSDDLEIKEYFDWCDSWIAELTRVLKPGKTLTLLNIPLWSIRHFLFMDTLLEYQNWIVWDALAFPVRRIMPAHYTILAFSKGPSRELPGLTGEAGVTDLPSAPKAFKSLEPMAQEYCLRARCIRMRQIKGINDRAPLTDLWGDIHRLKHNSRRVDHPTQLPSHLMYRLISIFTKPGEVVLDCFNGAGTTTLTAHQLGRRYIGIEKSQKYCDLARERHEEILKGLNPFRKVKRELTAKNSPVPRMPKQNYEVPKKTLQLEVRRVAKKLGHLPDHEELAQHGKYPIRYYDEYFVSWGEVCAAARTTGMTELPPNAGRDRTSATATQLSFNPDNSEN